MSGEQRFTQAQVQAYLKYRLNRARGRYPDDPVRLLSELETAINTVVMYPHLVPEAVKANGLAAGDEIAAAIDAEITAGEVV